MQLSSFRLAGYSIAAIIISLGGFLNGYDTGSIGAVTVMPAFETNFGKLTPMMRGWTVSIIMLTGTLPSFFAGQLADGQGHLRVIEAGALIFTLGAIFQAAAPVLSMFIVGRALGGIGQGLWIGNISVYITEIAPSTRRGALVSLPQLMCTLGICLGYFTCYGTVLIDSTMAYRIPYVIQAVLGIVLALSCMFLPTSPRWLVSHDRRSEAYAVVDKLGIQRAEAEKDILTVPPPVEEAHKGVQALLLPFRRQYRARTVLALFVLGMVQLSGIDGVLYYAPTLFEQAGLPEQSAGFLASGLSAILMLVVTVPALIYADRMGRRKSVIIGGVTLSVCMFLIGALYASNSVHSYGVGRWFVIVLIFVFALTYSVTWGVVGKIYASEIQPAKTRASASCIAQALGFFTNWIVAYATPIFLAHSAFGAYFLFGALAAGTVFVLAISMPETRGLPLEAIQEAFNQPVMRSWSSLLRRRIVPRPASVTSSQEPTTGDSASIQEPVSIGESASIELQSMTPVHLIG